MTKETTKLANVWSAQENQIHFYKMMSIGLGALALFVLIFTVMAYFRDPIVVVRTRVAQEFYGVNRTEVKIGKSEIEDFVYQYLKALYVWESFDPIRIAAEIRPFSNDGLVQKIMETQTRKFGKVHEKKIAQDLAFVKVHVSDDHVTATFLRILTVEGIPLVVPTELTFSLIEGRRTRFNPMGVYVSGITESENGTK
jgi:hypothetical protein